ncbi:hypothetical protein HK405_007031 [Cladochytrium tenue]|nr:hypothetical protein HK405_007031 [Cladochytrium tenue]
MVNLFSKAAWPKYRSLWFDGVSLAPESVLVCVQCAQPYRESDNHPGSLNVACTLQMWSSVKADDYRRTDTSSTAEIGRVLPGHPTDANKIFIRLTTRTGNTSMPLYFGVFSLSDLESVNPDVPIRYLSEFPDGLAQGPLEAKASWIMNAGTIVGIKLYCKSFTSHPSTADVFFSFDKGVPRCAKLITSPTIFGERPIRSQDPWEAYHGIPRLLLHKGPPRLRFPLPRDAEEFPPVIPSDCPVLIKFKSVTSVSFSPRMDQFTFSLYLTNNANRPATILECACYWMLRGGPVARQTAWAPVESMKAYLVGPDQKPISLPIAINPFHTVTVTIEVALSRDLETNWRTQSVLARMGPLLFDVEFGVAGATAVSQMVEYVNTKADSVFEPPADPGPGRKELVVIEDTKLWDRESFYIVTRGVPSSAGDEEAVLQVKERIATLRTLRVAFCRWALAQANLGVNDGTFSVEGNKVLLWSSGFNAYSWKVWVLIDPPRRRAYAVRVDAFCGTDGTTVTKFAILPDYGDAIEPPRQDSLADGDFLLTRVPKELQGLSIIDAVVGLSGHQDWGAMQGWEQPLADFKKRRNIPESQLAPVSKRKDALGAGTGSSAAPAVINEDALANRLAETLGKAINKTLAPLEQRMLSLEREVSAMHQMWRTYQMLASNIVAAHPGNAIERLRGDLAAFSQDALQRIDWLASMARRDTAAAPATAATGSAVASATAIESLSAKLDRFAASMSALEGSLSSPTLAAAISPSTAAAAVADVVAVTGELATHDADVAASHSRAAMATPVEQPAEPSAEAPSEPTTEANAPLVRQEAYFRPSEADVAAAATAAATAAAAATSATAALEAKLALLEAEIVHLREDAQRREAARTEALPGQLRAAVDRSLESHMDLISAIVKMSMESRLADLENESMLHSRLLQAGDRGSWIGTGGSSSSGATAVGGLGGLTGFSGSSGNGSGGAVAPDGPVTAAALGGRLGKRGSVTLPAGLGSVIAQVSEVLGGYMNTTASLRRTTIVHGGEGGRGADGGGGLSNGLHGDAALAAEYANISRYGDGYP